jgi:pilus assembly protein CpaB
MRPKSLLLLVLALGCGLIASIGISQVMERRNAGGSNVETVDVLVAKVEIPVGDAIKAESVKLLAVPKNLVPADSYTKIEDIQGKRTKSKLLVDEIIRTARLADGKDTQVPDGFRVVTIKTTADRGGNLLKPGDRVDVQVYLRAGSVPGVTQPSLRTFLGDVRVFAVDAKTEAADDEAGGAAMRTVSLLVNPEQAEKVTFASNIGQVQLVMRSSLDKDSTLSNRRMDLSKLFGASDTPGDREGDKVAANPATDKPAEPKSDGGIQKAIQDGLAAMASKAQSAAPTKPPVDAFTMIGYNGVNGTQYFFGDTSKAPQSSSALGAASNGTEPTTTAPTVDAPATNEPAPNPPAAPAAGGPAKS